MQCVLSGTPVSSSKCKAVLKKLRNKRLSSKTEHAHNSKICHRRHMENKAKGERKSKERAAKERKNKAVAKERATKRRREQAAKAKAREQHAKAHERRSKAAERASKERSGKLERANKHKAALARRIHASHHRWLGNINGWDGHMNWHTNGHTYVSGL